MNKIPTTHSQSSPYEKPNQALSSHENQHNLLFNQMEPKKRAIAVTIAMAVIGNISAICASPLNLKNLSQYTNFLWINLGTGVLGGCFAIIVNDVIEEVFNSSDDDNTIRPLSKAPTSSIKAELKLWIQDKRLAAVIGSALGGVIGAIYAPPPDLADAGLREHFLWIELGVGMGLAITGKILANIFFNKTAKA